MNKNPYTFAQKVVYKGKMQSYQLYGNPGRKQQVVYERDEFNPQQNFLYKRVLFGLSVYSEEELTKMHWDKKKRILKVHSRAQTVLNIWKHQLSNQWTADLLTSLFWNSNFAKEYADKFDELIIQSVLVYLPLPFCDGSPRLTKVSHLLQIQ